MGSLSGHDFDVTTKQTMGDTGVGVDLAAFRDRLWIAWVGEDNHQLNVMGSRTGNDFDVTTKQIMGDTSDGILGLCVFEDKLWISWRGSSNFLLNLMASVNGNDFDSRTKATFQITGGGPVTAFRGPLWLGEGVPGFHGSPGKMLLIKVGRGALGALVASAAVVVRETGQPVLTVFNGRLVAAWLGGIGRQLNVGNMGIFL
jgi:hypothetical protein